jgi:hypothetical protein
MSQNSWKVRGSSTCAGRIVTVIPRVSSDNDRCGGGVSIPGVQRQQPTLNTLGSHLLGGQPVASWFGAGARRTRVHHPSLR